MTLFSLIFSDYRRYRAIGGNQGSFLGIVLLSQGLWASSVYRVSHAIGQIKNPILRRPLRIVFLFVEKWIEILTGIRIPGECQIGKGLYIGHFGHIILSDQAVLGENCNLSQGVTIGASHRGKNAGAPVIGDRVYIGPNAVIFGKITIDSDSAIGAGAIVTKSFSERSVIAGNPARLISQEGSFEMIRYDAMDRDPARRASLALRETA